MTDAEEARLVIDTALDAVSGIAELCRSLGGVTPEGPYPAWQGPQGPVTVAPLFLLYDYTFRTAPGLSREGALAATYEREVVCSDEFLLHPDPYESRQAWCEARVKETEVRLAALDPATPIMMVNHYPLVRDPTRVLHHPECALWCGTERTADWHRRFTVAAMVYGHLHIPQTTVHDGVRFEEVSVGYPREWRRLGPVRRIRVGQGAAAGAVHRKAPERPDSGAVRAFRQRCEVPCQPPRPRP
ncbi:metallophosphoesterase [Streptomyces sp. NBC_00984]|uniref:hypothetical protein n=1 Tax=Streptomyces sp. NBC_00984 TaxID=2903700 RepID=UPI00386A965A|nr:metallophosphoesterase [Streptomyces sp. NBC_00984]